MKTTIDGAGRVVIPKAVRHRLGLTGGQELDVVERDGSIEISPLATPVRLVSREGVLVAEPDRPLPALTAEEVRDTLEHVRR